MYAQLQNRLTIILHKVGVRSGDSEKLKSQKVFLNIMGLLMGASGLFFGLVCAILELKVVSVIPLVYFVLTASNFLFFYYSANFKIVSNFQIFITIIVPFSFHWLFGNLIPPGMVILWTLLPLICSIALSQLKYTIRWFIFVSVLFLMSLFLHDLLSPLALNVKGSLIELFFELNSILIMGVLIGIMVFFIGSRDKANLDLEQLTENLEGIVEKRTADLAENVNALTSIQEELRQNNEELLTLNEHLQTQGSIIEEKELKLRTIIESQGEGFCIYDLDETFVFANPAACEIFGLSKEEIIGKKLKDFVTENDWLKIIAQTQSRFKNIRNNYDITIRLMDGTEKHLIVTGAPYYDINKQIEGTIGTFTDITERRKEKERLSELNLQQKILLDNIPAHIFYKNNELEYIMVNNSYASYLGIEIDTILNKKDSDIINTEVAVELEEFDRRVLRDKKPIYNYEQVIVNKDGMENWISSSKVPYFDENGNVMGIIGIIHDITTEKEQQLKIVRQKNEIESVHKDITDSINYAQKIQYALLTKEELIRKWIPEYFILFRPKEQVSGDFYYLNKVGNQLVFTVADCTGHGVPGGFLTMLGITYLHEVVKREDIAIPGKVLNILRKRIKTTFRFFDSGNKSGFDIALCIVDTETNILKYAGAYNPLYIIRKNELLEYPGTRNPIGSFPKETDFETHEIQLENDDIIYVFSDGYQDQFGGAAKRKFTRKRFRELLFEIHTQPLQQQHAILKETIIEWQKNLPQIDDITVMGIKWKM